MSFSSTKPNSPDSHKNKKKTNRLVQSLPSQTLPVKRSHKTMLLLIEEIQFPRHQSSDQATAFNGQKHGEFCAKVHHKPYYVRPRLQQEAVTVRDYSLGQMLAQIRSTVSTHGRDRLGYRHRLPAEKSIRSTPLKPALAVTFLGGSTKAQTSLSSVYSFLLTAFDSSMARHHEPILGSSGVDSRRSYCTIDPV